MTVSSSLPSSVSPAPPPAPVKRRVAWELALLYAGLIGYASLYPFAPWSSNGLPWWSFVTYPWPRYWSRFDVIANLLGYLPLGFLLAMAALRSHGRMLAYWA